MKPSIIVTVLFLLLISIVHLLRLVLQVKVTAGSVELPLWVSIPASVFTAGLAVWLWLQNKK